MRHRFECPLRWADMDLLGHVNNVTYLDYLQEARIDMMLTHAPDARLMELAEGVQILRHEVQYLVPLTFRPRPVLVDTWVVGVGDDSFVFAHEVYDEGADGRVVYLRARTTLSPYLFGERRVRALTGEERAVLAKFREADPMPAAQGFSAPRASAAGTYPLRVRFSDLDAYAQVDDVQHFEFFQEARVDYLTKLLADAGHGIDRAPIVIAQTDIEFVEPMTFRTEPYVVQSWVSRVGGSSYVIEGELRDPSTGSGETGDRVLSRARVVMVAFDPVTQRAAPAPEAYRNLLLAELEASA